MARIFAILRSKKWPSNLIRGRRPRLLDGTPALHRRVVMDREPG
jgi:hypothetical protein